MQQRRKQHKGDVQKSRKELRKEQRKLKKAKRNEFFERKKNKSKKIVAENAEHVAQINRNADMFACKRREKKILRKYNERERIQKLQVDMKNQRIKQLKKANQEEDKIIKKLEKQLKLSKRKLNSVPKSFTTDGLDCILHKRVYRLCS
jgi:hypothetical protein